ncbi:MAG: Nif3-like dinuclear metal center hexameric protein [Erysipelotrichaceae bacterium]|nr:Nif3-like dinuclear metal center hexameric protein [Erysipelotrichaceae bacterium]
MKISEIIDTIKNNSHDEWNGIKIKPETTRDKILYGNPDQECTGIVVTLFASADVIRKAKELGANFIIVHEALFWNHGDHTDWLVYNRTYKEKIALLGDMCVWRDHDYIHAGINMNGEYRDGIFVGLMNELGWNDYLVNSYEQPRQFRIPSKPVKELGKELMEKLGLSGIKYTGDIEGNAENVYITSHIIGPLDNKETEFIENNDIDTVLAMEITDFTVSEYIRDSAMLNLNKRVLAVGHFNMEEPGMKFFSEYLKDLFNNKVPVEFVRSGEAFSFLTK